MAAASFALVPSLSVSFAPLLFPSSPPEGREGSGRGRGRGWEDCRPSRRCPVAAGCCSLAMWWRGVAMTSPRSGRGGRPYLSLSVDTSWRSGERLAMVWTVKTSDGAEERRGTGEEVGGILRPGSLSSFPSACSFAMPCPYYLKEGKEGKEEDEYEAVRMADRRGSTLPFFLLLFFLYI